MTYVKYICIIKTYIRSLIDSGSRPVPDDLEELARQVAEREDDIRFCSAL
jgi:hypothetical protein